MKYTVKELRKMAKTKGIKGYSKMRKADLINILDIEETTHIFALKKDNMFILYTKKSCPYCYRAKELLEKKGEPFREIEVTETNRKNIYKKIDKKTKKYRFFPIIFNPEGTFIGGYSELKRTFGKGQGCVIL